LIYLSYEIILYLMPLVTPTHLIALAAVERTGSLTGASAALGKTQPAISAQIRELADAIGAPLFTRHRYGVKLTHEAKQLLPYAEACARSVEGVEQEIVRLRGLEAGRLHVLASTSVAVYLLPSVLAAFHAMFPGIEIKISRHQAESAIVALERSEGDVAVVRAEPTLFSRVTDSFLTKKLMADETVLVVPRGHSLEKRSSVSINELDGLKIVVREMTSATQLQVERLARLANISFKISFQTIGVEGLKEAVLQGFGAGFLSRLSVERELANGTLKAISIRDHRTRDFITVIHSPPGQCAPSVVKFVKLLCQHSKASYRVASSSR
jgi:DNA-binding transcriptional LysR family regulator